MLYPFPLRQGHGDRSPSGPNSDFDATRLPRTTETIRRGESKLLGSAWIAANENECISAPSENCSITHRLSSGFGTSETARNLRSSCTTKAISPQYTSPGMCGHARESGGRLQRLQRLRCAITSMLEKILKGYIVSTPDSCWTKLSTKYRLASSQF